MIRTFTVTMMLCLVSLANADDYTVLAHSTYAEARAAVAAELDALADPKARADIIIERLAQRNPDWSWRWRYVNEFGERLSGKTGFERTLMLLGSDSVQQRNGAFRTLLYASELESQGRSVSALNTRVNVPGLGPTDVDILLSDGTLVEVKSTRVLRNTPQLRTQLSKLATLADEGGWLADTQLNGRRVLAVRGRVPASVREFASANGFEVYDQLKSSRLPGVLTEAEAVELRTAARGLTRAAAGRTAGAGVGTALMIIVLEGGHTLYLQITGRLDGALAAERYGEVAAKASASGGAVYAAALLGENPLGVTVIVTAMAIYIITDTVIDNLRPYYHSGALTVDDVNAALPKDLTYPGGIRAALPQGYSKAVMATPPEEQQVETLEPAREPSAWMYRVFVHTIVN